MRRSLLLPALLVALGTVIPSTGSAIELLYDEDTGRRFALGGYTQPYVRWVQDPERCREEAGTGEVVCSTERAADGFGLQRTRLSIDASQDDLADIHIEISTIPDLQLREAVVNVNLVDGLRFRFGRYRPPFSGQELISESRLQLNRAELIRGTPGRQLGASFAYGIPASTGLPENLIHAEFGIYNGEADKERGATDNIDSEFLYMGRLEINPFGYTGKRHEGDLRPVEERNRPLLSIAGSWGTQVNQPSAYEEEYFGADLTFKLAGLAFYSEYFRRNRDFDGDDAGIDQFAQGWNIQLGYMAPLPWVQEHLEFVARVEQYDPQSAARGDDNESLLQTIGGAPGAGPAVPGGLQSQRNYIGGINYFVRGHDFKVQLNYTHRVAQEEFRLSAGNPDVDRDTTDDTFTVQATYRF